mgnify:FL=1
MSQVKIAMSALFGSLFFLLLPMYDIFLQQNTIIHPLIRIVTVLILILTIISAVNTSKKFSHFTHDLKITQKRKKSQNHLPSPMNGFFNLSFVMTVSSFMVFLMIKTIVLKSMTFFFESFFGILISLLLSILFYVILLWSAFIIIRDHIDKKSPDKYLSFEETICQSECRSTKNQST